MNRASDVADLPSPGPDGRACPSCATPLPQAARFCMTCGTAVGTPRRTPTGLRFVTVAFCDISGSTQLATRLSPEVWHGVLDRYFAQMREAIESCGGRVEKFIGDAVVGVFGADRPADDDALRAVRAALDGLARSDADADAAAADGHGIRLTVRFGVASGQVVLADRDSSFAIGAVMNRAARLQAAAPVGGALIDVRTWLLVRDQVRCDQVPPVTAKGFDTALQAWTVASGAQEPLPAAPFVNQRELLGRVRAELAVRLRTAGRSVITVDGEVGSGKTALLRRLEGSTELDQALVLPVECGRDDREQGLWRLLHLDRDLAALESGGTAPAAGAARPGPLRPGPTASTAEVKWRIGRRLAALSRDRAVVLLVDNAQWAPDALWEVIDGAAPAAGSAGSVVFVLAGREVPGGLGGADSSASAFTVPPLSAEHSRRLLGLLRAEPRHAERPVPDLELHFVAADAEAIVDRAGGNPLFLEQLAALAADGIDDLVAPSASAALGARIEALSAASRRVLICLGAWGTSVGSAALGATCGLEPGELGAALAELTSLGLAPQQRSPDGGRRYECHSAAQVAYAQSPLADRASVHAAVARELQRRAADTPSALDPAAAHAERSHACLRELRPGSAEETAAAELAAGCLVAAARCAVGRGDVRQAVELVSRARGSGLGEPALTLEIASIESYALAACGRTDEALRLIDAMKAEAPAAANPAAAFQLLANELALRPAGADALASAREPAERTGDRRSEARLLLLAGLDAIGSGEYPQAERLLLRAHDRVRRTGPGLGTAEIHANLALCLAYGDRPVGDALRRCRGLGEDTADAPVLHAVVGCSEALLRQSAGDGAGARRLLARAAEVFSGVGHPAGLAGLHRFRSAVAEYAGELPEAAAELREAAEVFLRLGAEATAARCRAAAWVLECSATPAPVSGTAAPELPEPAFGWDDEVLACQVRALCGDRPTARAQLRRALDVIGAVHGAGARLLPLAGCLRLARRTGAEGEEREADDALAAAAAARGAVRPAV